MKPLSYFIGKIIGILLMSPIIILAFVIGGLWEAIKAIYEATKAVIDVYKELKCDHSYEVTDSQGHDMECSKCGKLWRLYEN